MGVKDSISTIIETLEKLGVLKNFAKRAEVWLILGIIGTLADEWIKEGYLFKVEEILNFAFTHEKLVVGLFCALIVVIVYHLKKKPEEVNE